MKERKYRMTELTYSKTGDYLIPDLELDSSDMQSFGRYGMLRESFLREHHRGTYTSMLLTGRLELHLREIDQQAQELVEQIVADRMARQGVDETYKTRDPLGWVQAVNSFMAQAEEIVLADTVYR